MLPIEQPDNEKSSAIIGSAHSDHQHSVSRIELWQDRLVCGRIGWSVAGWASLWQDGLVCGRMGWSWASWAGLWQDGLLSGSRVGHPFFSKDCNVLAFFPVLYKRTDHFLRSFPFFIKQRNNLCALSRSL